MANEFQTRYLEILKNSPYIQAIAKPGRAIQNIEYYSYNTLIGSAAAPLVNLVPQTSTIETQADSDFAITFMSAAVLETVNGIATYNNNITLQIQDLSTGKLFFNIPTVVGLVTGGGGFPFVLPAPRVVASNSQLLFTAMNRDSAINPVGLYIALHGSRIYYV